MNWVDKFYTEHHQGNTLTKIEYAFLLETFDSFEDFDSYMKAEHYLFLINSRKLMLTDCVEHLLNQKGDLMNFIKNKTYKITTPSQDFNGVKLEGVTNTLKFLDKEENWSKLTTIQQNMAYSELYTLWEDEHCCIVVLKIKEDYIVREE